MVTMICKECGKEFTYEKESSCKAQLKMHIKIAHNMELVDYIVKHEYGGVRPKCPCGCGHELNLAKSGERWRFTQYYQDTCYGRLVRSGNEEIMQKYKETHKRSFSLKEYYERNYDKETYVNAYKMLQTKKYALSAVSKEYHIDARTLKKVWIALEITTTEELQELLDYTKYQLSGINYPTNVSNSESDNMSAWMYHLIKQYPGKYTIHSLIAEYNDKHKENPCEHNDTTTWKKLYNLYGDEIDIYLAVGYHSTEEYRFFEILRYYIKDYIVRMGKKFVLEEGYIFYDIIIGSKLLIEYDSDGFFHKDNNEDRKISDKVKEEFAIKNGYKFLRLNKDDVLNPMTILKIQNILKDEIN